MKKAQLKKMEQWQVTMSLMGLNHDSMFYIDYEDPELLRDTLRQYHDLQDRLKDENDMVMKAALHTIAMDVSDDDIDEYHDYLEEKEQFEREAEAQRLIDENPMMVKLRAHGYTEVLGKRQYPKHHHFKFNMPDGLEVRGRCFAKSWETMVIWLEHHDAKKKLQRQCWRFSKRNFVIPNTFPESWRDGFYRVYPQFVAMVVAGHCINKKIPRGIPLVLPKA